MEKQVLLHSGRCQVIDDYDGERVVENMAPDFEEGIRSLFLVLTSLKVVHLGSREYGDGSALHWEVSSFKANNASCAVIYLKGGTYTHLSPTILYLQVQCRRLLEQCDEIGGYVCRYAVNLGIHHISPLLLLPRRK